MKEEDKELRPSFHQMEYFDHFKVRSNTSGALAQSARHIGNNSKKE